MAGASPTRTAGGQSIVFPDVCKTPSPGGPVPLPYPNTGMSSDASRGPTTVTVNGKMPRVKGAQYKQTAGDEAGMAGGGVVSGSTKGPAEFMLSSAVDMTARAPDAAGPGGNRCGLRSGNGR